jgi:hypothetical protein
MKILDSQLIGTSHEVPKNFNLHADEGSMVVV